MIEVIDNKILRDGEFIGVINAGIATLAKNPGGRIKAQIRAAAELPDLEFEISANGVQGEPATGEGHSVSVCAIQELCSPPESPCETKRLVEAVAEVLPPCEAVDPAEVVSTELPPPNTNPALGDKDPIYQRWYVTVYGEEQFRKRWPGRPLP